MADRYAGKQGRFTRQVQQFADKTKAVMDITLREIIIEIGSRVIRMSPVGNPELWAHNRVARQYNKAVGEHNANLRNDPANLTKAGRLKAGRKLHDGMDIAGPEGYVGGRFRSNWQFSIGTPAEGTLERLDASGATTLAKLKLQVEQLTLGQTAYLVNNLPYGIALEYGHSTQAPHGMVRVTLTHFQQIVDDAIRNNQP